MNLNSSANISQFSTSQFADFSVVNSDFVREANYQHWTILFFTDTEECCFLSKADYPDFSSDFALKVSILGYGILVQTGQARPDVG